MKNINESQLQIPYNWTTGTVPIVEDTDPVQGGDTGASNASAVALTHRTKDIHSRLSLIESWKQLLTGADQDTIVNTMTEMLSMFSDMPENAGTILTQLGNKVPINDSNASLIKSTFNGAVKTQSTINEELKGISNITPVALSSIGTINNSANGYTITSGDYESRIVKLGRLVIIHLFAAQRTAPTIGVRDFSIMGTIPTSHAPFNNITFTMHKASSSGSSYDNFQLRIDSDGNVRCITNVGTFNWGYYGSTAYFTA